MKLIRRTQHIDKEIVNVVCYLQRFPELYCKFIEPRTNEDDLYIQMQLPPKPIRTKKLKNNVFVFGSSYVNVLSGEMFEALVKVLNFHPQSKSFSCFNRIELNNLLIYRTNYKRMVSRCNSVVKAVKENATFFALVDFFVWWEEDVLAVAKRLHCTHYNETNHITAVKECESLFVFVQQKKFKRIYVYWKANLTRNNVELPQTTVHMESRSCQSPYGRSAYARFFIFFYFISGRDISFDKPRVQIPIEGSVFVNLTLLNVTHRYAPVEQR